MGGWVGGGGGALSVILKAELAAKTCFFRLCHCLDEVLLLGDVCIKC